MEPFYLRLFFAGLISFLLTVYLIPLVCKIAWRFNILDIPDGTIKKHKKPTPYLGGLAVYLGFLISLCLVYPFENNILFFLLGSTLLLFVGLLDDLIRMKHYQKFFGQLVACICFCKAGFYLKENFFIFNNWQIPFSLFWMLLIINAFNLVDVMDGLASTIALFATFNFLIIALCMHQYSIALLLMACGGALAAFLLHNKPPAALYLGDAGSLFIGGFLANIPFLVSWSEYNCFGLFTPCIILAIPLLEVTTLIMVRTYKGVPFYNATPDHFSIYLKQNGWTSNGILLYVATLSIILGITSLLFILNVISFSVIVLLSTIFLVFWFIMLHKKCK